MKYLLTALVLTLQLFEGNRQKIYSLNGAKRDRKIIIKDLLC